jgi:hypothetical protein
MKGNYGLWLVHRHSFFSISFALQINSETRPEECGTMAELKKLLLKCERGSLEDIVQGLCDMFQADYLDGYDDGARLQDADVHCGETTCVRE